MSSTSLHMISRTVRPEPPAPPPAAAAALTAAAHAPAPPPAGAAPPSATPAMPPAEPAAAGSSRSTPSRTKRLCGCASPPGSSELFSSTPSSFASAATLAHDCASAALSFTAAHSSLTWGKQEGQGGRGAHESGVGVGRCERSGRSA